MYSPEFPEGDYCGNDFNLTQVEDITELHALWDSLIYEWNHNFTQPLNDSNWNLMTSISASLRDEHKWSDADIQTDL